MPSLLLQLVAHVSANRVVLSRWASGELGAASAIAYPDGLHSWASAQFRGIKARQALLLGVKSGNGYGGSGSGGGGEYDDFDFDDDDESDGGFGGGGENGSSRSRRRESRRGDSSYFAPTPQTLLQDMEEGAWGDVDGGGGGGGGSSLSSADDPLVAVSSRL